MLKRFELGVDELDLIVKELPKSGVIVLQGDLASGKTTLVKSIVKSAGINENVSSPTFSVMQNYGNIYHYDIYQNGFESIKKNGLFENFFEDGLHIVEWGDENLINMLGKYEIKVCVVKISVLNDKRIYEVDFA
ncbi:tRNA (adenosine(37)-N6)-threonylcarbamoyltransferase complex ATPase subunit type 1 TsaE [Campylobacter fetus]|uniref:tRNA threonylcarbamoyladenosine biosynthesis protein TsaE n=3 Tax=Campylobacter fetus TaxID=196 RepID=A0A5L4ZVC9_CAMFE|nr:MULTISPECIES: tRNA (adenosine(37)-N6)-threonylcarbamoyltransferase complex ATPase subunit type 1 TsaE [Campylobacter]OCS23352.1 tRNA threonylcarbamoyladenosine biosynthesis protein TsaE [Campylobacter fetus subsp. venerealis cfvi97/532]OCS26358.1 tRNA threonylcarbamoyladenosine biosynthesis protein TsaE [Campylobacter fetus subsp. venerealis cfvB10]OCS30719.1 tRNA threonylcarbamoyladenosine biosynthesis protein TsaE [Campylobacter fetus subsp. venerealis LMG 6570 = CCUG 33900]OCS42556.1 tRNA